MNPRRAGARAEARGARGREERGLIGWLRHTFTPHSHDGADRVDDALESSSQGIRAVKVSLWVLVGTGVLQLAVVMVSGSVALFADTVHNFSDALTAVPLWIAFALARRPATRAFTHGLGRVEDLAGLFVVLMIAVSAAVVIVESVRRFLNPRDIDNVGLVLAAAVVGFLGNEAVAVYRIRVGHRIGSAALVADGLHARTDGLTSLAVAAGALGVWWGYPLADPIVGIAVGIAILVVLVSAARSVGRRLLDGVEPGLAASVRSALDATDEEVEVGEVRIRWVGHRLDVGAVLEVKPGTTLEDFRCASRAAERSVRAGISHVGRVDIVLGSSPVEAQAEG